MTVSTTTYKNTYTGDDADVTFEFSFQIEDESHLTVQLVNSSGTVQTQTLSVDYTVSGTGNTNGSTDYTSGTVTFTTAPASTDTVIVKRSTPLTQGVDYVENDNFPAETHEGALDKITLMVQDQQEQLDRCFKIDYTGSNETDYTLPDPTANYYLRFNDAADGLEAVEGAAAAGIDDVVDDPSPQLGGNLDVNGNNIVSASNGNIIIEPNGTGEVRLNSATITVEDKIIHLGDTDTFLNFTTNAIDFQAGGSSIIDINASGLRIGGSGSRITVIADEDDMISNSDTKLASQQSIKAYVDTAALDADDPILEADLDVADYDIVTTSGNKDIELNPHGSGDIILTADTGGWIDLASDIIYVPLDIIHKGDTNNKITFGTDTQDYQTGGSSRLDISDSGVRMGGANSRVTTILDEDAMGSNSATALSTQQSIKAYVDNKAASQAEQEAGSVTTTYVSPGRQQYHPSAAKFWAIIDADSGGAPAGADPTLDSSYNVSSITDNGISGGQIDIDVNFTTSFSGTDYCVLTGVGETAGAGTSYNPVRTRSTGSCNIDVTVGYEHCYIVGYGDQ